MGRSEAAPLRRDAENPLLGTVQPELVWGVFPRLLGLVYVIAFGSLLPQIRALVGKRGIAPVELKLAAIRRDFPGLRRFLYFPSLLWFGHGDVTLVLLLAVGVACGVAMMFGGPAAVGAGVCAYIVFLSFDVALRLSFPWECVLLEAGILAMFLPPTLPLPDLSATSLPAPAVAWAYRLLLFRVVFGFGKFKFTGSTRQDLTYLKGFLVNQPLPSPVAWAAHRLPLPILQAGVLSLFLVEIPGAALTLVPSPVALLGGLGIVGLMVVILVSGNFGYFNWIVAFLCWPLLDWATPRALSLHDFQTPGLILPTTYVAANTLGAVFYFPFNSYVSQCWHRWPFWRKVKPRIIALPVALLRAVQPLRWLHSYGVFPPKSMAPIRCVAVTEVSWDGETWHELEYALAPTRPEHRPRFIAPHLPRWDQTLIYETYGTTEHSLAYSVANSGMPYGHAAFSDAECMLERVLEGEFYEGVVFRRGSIPGKGAPLLARMRAYLMRPTTPEERRRTGLYWSRELVGPHYPTRKKNPDFWRLWLPHPELFDFDDLVWKRRSTLGRVIGKTLSARSLSALLADGTKDLTQAHIDRFFDEFLPACEPDRRDWSRLQGIRTELASRYSALELHAFERVAGRLGAVLEARLEPLLVATKAPRLELDTHYELALFARWLVLKGRDVVTDVLATPEHAIPHLEKWTAGDGLYLLGVFRLDALVWEAHKIRLLDTALVRSSERFPGSERAESERKLERTAKTLWGVSQLTGFLRERFREPEYCDGAEERYPLFVELDSGEIVPAPSPDVASTAPS